MQHCFWGLSMCLGVGEPLGSLGSSSWPSPLLQTWLNHPYKSSLQEQLAGQVFSALAEAVGHPHSLYTAGRRKLQVSLFGLGNWSVAGGLTVAFQSLEAARVGGANTHPSKWALGLERVHRL